MAKQFKTVILDDSPKNVEKINKALEKKKIADLLEGLKEDAAKDSAVDYPKMRIFLTDNYVCCYNLGIKYDINIVPLQSVVNVYRSSMIGDSFDFDNLYLIVETKEGYHHSFLRMPRGGKKKIDDKFADIIKDIKERMN